MRSSTDKQIEASRKNGALSRGPVTPEGQKRSSRNALRHGMFARDIVLENEPKQNFTHITKRFRKQFRPDNEAENQLIDQLAASSWRLRRFWAMETGMLNQSMPDQGMQNPNVPGAASLDFGLCPPMPVNSSMTSTATPPASIARSHPSLPWPPHPTSGCCFNTRADCNETSSEPSAV